MYQKRTETCAKRIKTALYIRKMKQCDLCKLANVPKSSLSLYLSGAYEPKQDRIYSMAQALNVSEAWLMGYDVLMERTPSVDLQLFAQSSTDELQLTEGEKMMLDLFRQIPDEKQTMVLEMIRVALKTQG